MAVSLRHGREDCELWLQILTKVHDRGDVAATVAVIGSAPDGDDGFVFEMPLEPMLARDAFSGQCHDVPCNLH